MTDFRYAVRVLVRRPGLTLATIAVLALGIGATTVVFSLMRAVLLRPLPYHDPARLVHAFPQRAVAVNHQRHDVLTGTEVIEWQRRSTSVESLALLDSWRANLAPRMDLLGPDGAERLRGAFVTPNLFELLGVSAALGRTFSSQDAAGDDRGAATHRRLHPPPPPGGQRVLRIERGGLLEPGEGRPILPEPGRPSL